MAEESKVRGKLFKKGVGFKVGEGSLNRFGWMIGWGQQGKVFECLVS